MSTRVIWTREDYFAGAYSSMLNRGQAAKDFEASTESLLYEDLTSRLEKIVN